MPMKITAPTETEQLGLEYLDAGRNFLKEGKALLERVRAHRQFRRSARMIFDGARKEIDRARMLASTEEYAGCREALETLASEMEAMREEARALL